MIHPTGRKEGGHAYAVGGYDLRTGLAEVWQSWGRDHGRDGTVYIPIEELGALLVDHGECAVPRKR